MITLLITPYEEVSYQPIEGKRTELYLLGGWGLSQNHLLIAQRVLTARKRKVNVTLLLKPNFDRSFKQQVDARLRPFIDQILCVGYPYEMMEEWLNGGEVSYP